jgi:hypothetical protein
MAACNFIIPVTETGAALSKIQKAVTQQGGTFSGNETAGNISVSLFGSTITGTYQVKPDALDITITEKPFLLPCNAIEGFLKKQLEG